MLDENLLGFMVYNVLLIYFKSDSRPFMTYNRWEEILHLGYTLYIQTPPEMVFGPQKHTLNTFSGGIWMARV